MTWQRLLIVLAFVFAPPAAIAVQWDMPMAYSASNYHAQNTVLFARCVASATNNELQIVTHPGGSLLSGGQIKSALQSGGVAIGERLLSAHADETPLFGIDSIPFVATSFDASEKLWQAALTRLKSVLKSQNLIYLYSVPWPAQGFYFKKPVNSVADMKGLKLRTYNAATQRIATLAGMEPVNIEAADLPRALAAGTAEAFISSGSTGYDRKVWEHLSYFYNVRAWLPRNTVLVNKDAFDALDRQTQRALMSCGDEAAANGLAKARELTDFYLKALARNGIKVREPGEQLANELAGFGRFMLAEWLERAGEDGQAIFEAFRRP